MSKFIFKGVEYRVGQLLKIDKEGKFSYYIRAKLPVNKLFIIKEIRKINNKVGFIVDIGHPNKFLTSWHPNYFEPPIECEATSILYGANYE